MTEKTLLTGEDYPRALGQLFICGTAAYAISRVQFEENPMVTRGFVLLLGQGMLGSLVTAHKQTSATYNLPIFYEFTSLLLRSAPLALLNAQLAVEEEIYCNHLLGSTYLCSPMIPVMIPNTLESVHLFNIGSLFYFSFRKFDMWLTGLATTNLINFLMMTQIGEAPDEPDESERCQSTTSLFLVGLTTLMTLYCFATTATVTE